MEAGKNAVADIFNGSRILDIPFFQRAYVWEQEQWERFLEDMEFVSENNKPYFLGSIISKQQETEMSVDVGDIRTLIDGQQRLTTLIIFFKVLWLMENKNDYFERQFKLMRGSRKLALHHNHSNFESFEKISGLNELEDIRETEDGIDKILGAYNFFKSNIKKENLKGDVIMGRLTFVSIHLSATEDEQQIFDTINSLGVRLTTAELLKNYFFDRNDIQLYNENWKEVFEKDEETIKYWDKEISAGRMWRTFIDLFFYSYLQIKVQEPQLDVRANDKTHYARVDSLFDSYKNLIKNYQLEKREIIEEIREYADVFRMHFDYEVVNRGLTPESGIERINVIIFGLENSTLIPYTLFVLKNAENKGQKNELFDSVENYIMRRMITRESSKNYNQLFTERMISNRILSKQQFKELVDKIDDQVNRLPDDSSLRDAFLNEKHINKQSKGILYMIESKIRNTEKHATQLLGLDGYSLEHLMPKKWENNWSRLDTQEEKDNRNRKLLTLGNLSIITQQLNASIRDSSWSVKKSGSGNKGGLKAFSTGIEILHDFLELEDWNEGEIENRAQYLFEKAKSIWPRNL